MASMDAVGVVSESYSHKGNCSETVLEIKREILVFFG